MEEGVLEEGMAVVRVKTEMNLPNPALRLARIENTTYLSSNGRGEIQSVAIIRFQSAIKTMSKELLILFEEKTSWIQLENRPCCTTILAGIIQKHCIGVE